MPVGFNTEFNTPMGLSGLPFGNSTVGTIDTADKPRGKADRKQAKVEANAYSYWGKQSNLDASKNLIQYDSSGWNLFGQDTVGFGMFGQNNIVNKTFQENYTEANTKLGQIDKLLAQYKNNPTDPALQKQLAKIVNSANAYNFTFIDKFSQLLKDNFSNKQALTLIKQFNTNIQDNLVRQYLQNGGNFDQEMLNSLFSFQSKDGVSGLQNSLASGKPENINIVRSNGKLYLSVRVNGKEERAELNNSNFYIFKALYRNAMRGKLGDEAKDIFNLLGFDAKSNNFTVGGVILKTDISLSKILQIPSTADSGGMNIGTTALNEMLSGLSAQQLSRVVISIGDATNNIKSSSLYRVASFIKNPRFEMFGYVQNNGNLSASHVSFFKAVGKFKDDMRICITQHSLSTETINEFRELCRSNYENMNIDPIIKQAYQEAIDNPPRGPDDLNVQIYSKERTPQEHIARYNKELKELGLELDTDNRTFSEKVDLLRQNIILPFQPKPPDVNYANFYFMYQTTKQDYLNGQTGEYEENAMAIIKNYSVSNVTKFIYNLSTQNNIHGLDALTKNNITDHQVITFCYTELGEKQSKPVYLIGGKLNDGKYFFVDPLTGRNYSGNSISQIKQDYIEHCALQPFSMISYFEGGKVETKTIPMLARKRIVNGIETIGLTIGTVATIACLTLNPSGPLAGPAGTGAIVSFLASVTARTADTVERAASGEHISSREVFDLVSQWMLLLGGGGVRLSSGQNLTSKTVSTLYTMAKSTENGGLIMMNIGMAEDIYKGIINKDPAAALAILQASMMMAASVRVRNIAQNRSLTEAEKKHYGFENNETPQNFVARILKRVNKIHEKYKPTGKATPKGVSDNKAIEHYNKLAKSEKAFAKGIISRAEYIKAKTLFFDNLLKTRSEATREVIKTNRNLVDELLAMSPDNTTPLKIIDLTNLAATLESQPVKVKIEVLHTVLSAYHPDTAINHSLKMTKLVPIAQQVLNLSPAQVQLLEQGCLMHDMGKLFTTRKNFLDYANRPPDKEKLNHPIYGEEILRKMGVPEDLITLARDHHEIINGKGYPSGKENDSISQETQILTILDIFNALKEPRAYKDGKNADYTRKAFDKDIQDGKIDQKFKPLIEALLFSQFK